MWCSALVVLAVVVCSWVASCVHCVKVTVRLLLVSLCSPYVHDARSQKPKMYRIRFFKAVTQMRFYCCYWNILKPENHAG